jgi:hypothetical protein
MEYESRPRYGNGLAASTLRNASLEPLCKNGSKLKITHAVITSAQKVDRDSTATNPVNATKRYKRYKYDGLAEILS